VCASPRQSAPLSCQCAVREACILRILSKRRGLLHPRATGLFIYVCVCVCAVAWRSFQYRVIHTGYRLLNPIINHFSSLPWIRAYFRFSPPAREGDRRKSQPEIRRPFRVRRENAGPAARRRGAPVTRRVVTRSEPARAHAAQAICRAAPAPTWPRAPPTPPAGQGKEQRGGHSRFEGWAGLPRQEHEARASSRVSLLGGPGGPAAPAAALAASRSRPARESPLVEPAAGLPTSRRRLRARCLGGCPRARVVDVSWACPRACQRPEGRRADVR